MGDGGETHGTEPAEAAHGRAEQWVALEAQDERGVVVIDPEAEAHLIERFLAGRADADDAVGPLPGDPAAGGHDGVQNPVAEAA